MSNSVVSGVGSTRRSRSLSSVSQPCATEPKTRALAAWCRATIWRIERRFIYDLVLLAVGRTPNGKKIAADNAGVAVTDRCYITNLSFSVPIIVVMTNILP